jgi:predicted  nucleic acid-binding Zn-ribbon protein
MKNNLEGAGEVGVDILENSQRVDQDLNAQLENRGASKFRGTLSRWLKVAALGLGVTLGGEACSKEGVSDTVSAVKGKTSEMASGAWQATSEMTSTAWDKLWEDSDEMRKKVKDVEKFDDLKKQVGEKRDNIEVLESRFRDTDKQIKKIKEKIADMGQEANQEGLSETDKVIRQSEVVGLEGEVRIQEEVGEKLRSEIGVATKELEALVNQMKDLAKEPAQEKPEDGDLRVV